MRPETPSPSAGPPRLAEQDNYEYPRIRTAGTTNRPDLAAATQLNCRGMVLAQQRGQAEDDADSITTPSLTVSSVMMHTRCRHHRPDNPYEDRPDNGLA